MVTPCSDVSTDYAYSAKVYMILRMRPSSPRDRLSKAWVTQLFAKRVGPPAHIYTSSGFVKVRSWRPPSFVTTELRQKAIGKSLFLRILATKKLRNGAMLWFGYDAKNWTENSIRLVNHSAISPLFLSLFSSSKCLQRMYSILSNCRSEHDPMAVIYA